MRASPRQPGTSGQAGGQERHVRRSEVLRGLGAGDGVEPDVRHLRDRCPQVVIGQVEGCVDTRESIRVRAEYVVADVPGLRGEPGWVADAPAPRVMEVQ